ncbi:hypothetical protein [Actinokineospora sp. NPDC004072]
MPSSGPPRPQAFVDESFLECDAGDGFYIVAAAVIEPAAQAAARQVMVALLDRSSREKLHWNEMNHDRQMRAAAAVAALAGFHVVAIGTPVPRRRQDRARARCLERLVTELHGVDVTAVLAESRTPTLDARDLRTVIGARYNLPKGSRFHLDHRPGRAEPLLWVADIVAGAVRLHRGGDSRCRDLLAGSLVEIEIDTGC